MELSVHNIVLVAKQHEIEALRHLGARAEVAATIGHMIHALQNERGASSIFLASRGGRFEATRIEMVEASQAMEQTLRAGFLAQLQGDAGNAKLFSLMAWVLLGLDSLPALREQIGARAISAHDALQAFSRLIAGLVSLIFEVADAAVDPDISRLLVALFNLVQGKELAGQERALGALCFASGYCEAPDQERLAHLIDAQERSFQLFADFAGAPLTTQWSEMQTAPFAAQLERLRRVLYSARPGASLDANQNDKWFDCCTARLAGIWSLQCALVDMLQLRCAALIARAERDLLDAEGLLRMLREHPPAGAGSMEHFFDPDTPIDHALRLMPGDSAAAAPGQSIIQVLQAQSERLAGMQAELDTARSALNERKLIERAKGILMERFQISEAAAYTMLRKASMDQNRRLVDIAEAALSLPAFLAPARETHHR